MLLCVFERDQLHELYRNYPGLGYDITWMASREERMLDENLLSIGRRSALERTAYLVAFISSRARGASLESKKPMQIPITQQHIADTLGLSLVHTNKTIRKLIDRKLIAWRDGGCEIIDQEGLKDLAGWEGL
ncbi:Crp/Fnr family transcriptional regulator, partial [Mesorhizobium sp. M4B.F.Ca.ET.150.01.1.1]